MFRVNREYLKYGKLGYHGWVENKTISSPFWCGLGHECWLSCCTALITVAGTLSLIKAE